MSLAQTFKATLPPAQMEVLEEWLRNYNGAANTPAEELTLQQAFEEAVNRGLNSMDTQSRYAEQQRATGALIHLNEKRNK